MVKTGDEKDAGTDANVYLQMFGEKGKTQNFSLREEGDKRRFERGRMDKFLIRAQDIGKVIRNDGLFLYVNSTDERPSVISFTLGSYKKKTHRASVSKQTGVMRR